MIQKFASAFSVAAITLTLLTAVGLHAQDATWTGGTGDWNTDANWNVLVVPGDATNVFIPSSSVVTYSSPMAATAIGILTNQGTLNVNASGFNSGTAYMMKSGGTGKLFLGSGGAVSVTGNFATSSNSAISVVAGSSLTVSGEIYLGAGASAGTSSGTAGSTAFLTNSGGTITAAGLRINPGNGSVSASSRALIDGGVNTLGNVYAGRESGSTPPSLGTSGVVISNGIVNMTSLRIGNNAHGTVLIAGGVTTNSGWMVITNFTAGRPGRFIQRAGLFVNEGSVTNAGTGTAQVSYSVTGGTNIVGGLRFGADGAGTGISWFTNSATMYIGAGGISDNGVNSVIARLNPGGLLGATADWASSSPMALGAGAFVLKAAGLDDVAHNITFSGVLSGTGPLVKTGAGTLQLDGVNTYTAGTLINQGTLALGAAGSLAISSEILIATNTMFDVTAVSGGYTLAAGKIISGVGSVSGDVSVASTGIIDPGSNTVTGTLTFSNSVTQTGGARNLFNLSANPTGPDNDLVLVKGDLNVTNVNPIEITGNVNAGSIHPLIQYDGNLNGDISNFSLSGITGTLTNDPTLKMIAVHVLVTIRPATNVVWVGNAITNDWNVLTTTNWLNNGVLDTFTTGDTVLFNATGAANPNVNVAVPVSPASVTVSATGDYSFAGAGGIGGTGSLTKTNSGRLTMLNTNQFTGGVNLLAGVLSAETLAADGVDSPVGRSGTILIDGGTLEYAGANFAWNRQLTLGAASGGISVSNETTALTLDGALIGVGSLVKSGAGVLVLNTANSYGSGSFVNAGQLTVNNVSGAGSGIITLNGGDLGLGAVKPANTVDVQSPGVIRGGNTGGLSGVSTLTGDSDVTIAVTTGVFDFIGSMVTYSNTITMSNAGGATVRFNGTTGSSLATFDLGVGPMDLFIRNSLTNVNLGGLKGGPSTTLSGRGTGDNNGPTTHHIGANGTNTTFEGVIKNGSGGSSAITSIVKTGPGALTLSGINTYTGTTTISNGVLALAFNGSTDGSIDASTNINIHVGAVLDVIGRSDDTLQLGAAQTLMGSGTVRGSLNSSGTVSPGASIGTLTITNSATLGGTVFMELNTANGPQTNDVISAASITGGGTLTLTNTGPQLTVSNRFVLFSAPVAGGLTINALPDANGTTYTFTDNLATDGSITVATVTPLFVVDTNPTNITSTVNGTDLTLSWPASHLGWTLQSQTNARSIGLTMPTNTWFDVSGSDTTNQVVIPMNKVDPTVFYRLRLPQP